MGLRQFIPEDRDWLRRTAEEIGWDHLGEYYNRVFLLLLGMKHGADISIVKRVAPANYALFMGCLTFVISELAGYGIHDFTLEEDATVIHRI